MSSSASPNRNLDEVQSMKYIEWADLVTLDLSMCDLPGGKQELASQVMNAVRTSGFFSVKNYGIPNEDVEMQYKLSQTFFDLPLEEKLQFHDPEAWKYPWKRLGYRPIGGPLRKIQYQGKHRDNAQIYNIPRMNGFHDVKHPVVWDKHLEQMKQFQQEVNKKVVQKLLQVLAIALELPDENQLARNHYHGAKGEDSIRYIKYEAIPVEASQANDGIYAHRHTDIATLTLSFRQPIAGLQILDGDGGWKWVKPYEDQILVNVGDALTALTGGYFKSGVHRIHAPPKEQIHMDRYSLLYFARPDSDVIMESIKNSPVLQRAQLGNFEELDQGLNGREWMKFLMTQVLRQDDVEIAARAAKENEAKGN